ncbi:MAG TPA: glycine zipper 2TM domain-containing protein, partial [Nevskia sp.]|nr:glycine zipper 2TM domain-containing protein [Nevskia sp.]
RPKPRPVEQAEREPAPAPEPVREVCGDCGVISAITEERQKGESSGLGALGGAAAGGVAGSQFGKKSGKVLATIGGAVLGGLAGREVEKQVKAKTVYNVTVSMEAGGSRTTTVDALNGLGVGSKVRLSGGSLIPN